MFFSHMDTLPLKGKPQAQMGALSIMGWAII